MRVARLLPLAACLMALLVSQPSGAQLRARITPALLHEGVPEPLLIAGKGGNNAGNKYDCGGHGFGCRQHGYTHAQMSAPNWCPSHFAKDDKGRTRHRCPAKWGVKNAPPYPFDN